MRLPLYAAQTGAFTDSSRFVGSKVGAKMHVRVRPAKLRLWTKDGNVGKYLRRDLPHKEDEIR
jgi:hypothetical protein